MFADVGGLGTGNNLAIMPVANQEKVPQLFLQSGSTSFSSDQKANPWTLGWLPTYHSEGESFGKFLAAANKPITVASLAQNDDVGEDYVAGFKDGIKGSQVTIVAETTYNVTDPTVDAQVTKLAATKAEFNGMSYDKLGLRGASTAGATSATTVAATAGARA